MYILESTKNELTEIYLDAQVKILEVEVRQARKGSLVLRERNLVLTKYDHQITGQNALFNINIW
jgi:hypothetical protein